ncbi:MAG: glycoside hydrolase family 15 protein [Actinomycetia bacterium]|nr:glycoside hydrolase family 15 protein [Actinomycetes bacterium]
MAARIEDYALIGDTRTVALVCKEGSIDWFCAPRIDSPAAFAALLGEARHGRWYIAAADDAVVTRRYLGDSLVLETLHETPTGRFSVIDFMPPEHERPSIHRIVECLEGTVKVQMELIVRFDYGSIVPWVESTGDGLRMVAGPDALRFHSPVPLEGRGPTTIAEFELSEGSRRSFSLTWYDSAGQEPYPLDSLGALEGAKAWWHDWVSRCTYEGGWRDEVVRSLITLKALTYAPSGAVCAAATTSLPEEIGGVRNWDYRYSWLRDATLTLQAFLVSGYHTEASAWAQWLRRAVAGSPGDFQIMYGVRGRRRLTELELDWLPGYEGSAPVRIGNEASTQFQLDVFGEVMDAALMGSMGGLSPGDSSAADVGLALLAALEKVWDDPDDGIWEVRGPRRHFTHSKVMAWVAFDRAVKLHDKGGLRGGDVLRWKELRDTVHQQVCEKGWNDDVGAFTQYYGSTTLDASLLMMAIVGFLPADDPRIVSTVEAIQRDLMVEGFVKRYQTGADNADGLPGAEGAFLLTTFWLADNLALMGRTDEATEVFERLRGLRNDVGLLSEEYDPTEGRMLGNFPQAFSHIGLIHTAANLSPEGASPCEDRSAGSGQGD